MTSILDYGLMSKAVYSDDPQVPGWTTTQYRAGLGTGLQAAVFTRGQTTVVAFKGTSPSAISDIVADLKLGTGMNTSYFSDAETFTAQFAGGAGVVVTGHSLGGAIAQVVGNRRRIPFVTFNAPGVAIIASRNVHTTTVPMGLVRVAGGVVSAFRHPMQMMRDVSSAFHTSLGVNYRLNGDIVSQIGLHYGPIVHLQGQGDPLSQHGIDTMIGVLTGNAYGDVNFP